MRYIFFGSSEFAKIILKELLQSGMKPILVVTTPPKQKGRKKILSPTPVHSLAEQNGISVLFPENLESKEFIAEMSDCKPDLVILTAYGKIIPSQLLSIPKKGFLNLHPSLLPRWRGATPIQSAILAGDKETGVTLFLMDKQIDHGPIIQDTRYRIQDTKITYTELSQELAVLGTKLIIEALPQWLEGKIIPQPQNEQLATYCHKITSEDEKINWQTSAEEIDRKVRALNPNPGVYFECSEGSYTLINNKIIKIIKGFPVLDSNIASGKQTGEIFEYLNQGKKQVAIKCKEGFYVIEELRPAGKNTMTSESFLRGNKWMLVNRSRGRYGIVLSLLLLILLGVFISKGLIEKKSFYEEPGQAMTSNLQINIPQYISLTNFYKTYGQRMLGNEDIKIISREEWGADNRYADPLFIESFCQKNYCYQEKYNPEDTFSEKEYWRSLELLINYRKNFEIYDNFFLQSIKKENNFVYYYLPVEEIIIHHTAGKFTTDFEESKKELRKIYFMQAVQRKWQDIGYHYLIDGNGRIYEGNLGGKYSIGIHTYGHNKATVSISLMGDFRPNHDELTEPMKKALVNLVKYLIKEYELDISQEKFYLRKSDLSGRERSENIIKGHKELDLREEPTECPGIEPGYLREIIYSSLKTSAVYP